MLPSPRRAPGTKKIVSTVAKHGVLFESPRPSSSSPRRLTIATTSSNSPLGFDFGSAGLPVRLRTRTVRNGRMTPAPSSRGPYFHPSMPLGRGASTRLNVGGERPNNKPKKNPQLPGRKSATFADHEYFLFSSYFLGSLLALLDREPWKICAAELLKSRRHQPALPHAVSTSPLSQREGPPSAFTGRSAIGKQCRPLLRLTANFCPGENPPGSVPTVIINRHHVPATDDNSSVYRTVADGRAWAGCVPARKDGSRQQRKSPPRKKEWPHRVNRSGNVRGPISFLLKPGAENALRPGVLDSISHRHSNLAVSLIPALPQMEDVPLAEMIHVPNPDPGFPGPRL